MTLTSDGEQWNYETAHPISRRCRRVFEDMISRRNLTHCDPADIENFLAAKGSMVSGQITCAQSEMPETITALLGSEQFKNIVKMVVCVYSRTGMTLEDMEKIMSNITAAVPPEAEILHGWIPENQTDKNSVTIHLTAICSKAGAVNSELVFYELLVQYFKRLESFTVRGYYIYKQLGAQRAVFLELEGGKINIGYKGINNMEKELSTILNDHHFNKFFSKLIVDTARDRIYKRYLLQHDITDEMKNIIEAIFIQNSFSMLERVEKL